MARPPYDADGASADDVAPTLDLPETTTIEKRPTKQSLVLDLLRCEGGASLTAIVELTDWLPHTARAALTGLRKKGHTIERSSVEGESRYRIIEAAAQ